MRNQRGITLIALVITIIVLLILAGVSIAMLTGDNGILTKSTESRDETEKAEISEKVNMAIQAAYADAVVENTSDPDLTVSAIATQYQKENKGTTATGTEPSADGQNGTLVITDGTKKYTVTLKASGNSFITSYSDVSVGTATPET